jgi:hypothetical protein
MKCGGDPTQICGGPWASNVYAVAGGRIVVTREATCPGVPGSWRWGGQGVATFTGDASGGRVTARGNPHVKDGTWRCTGRDELEIVWDGGRIVDRARDAGGEMTGRNQHGHPFRSTRTAGGESPPPR